MNNLKFSCCFCGNGIESTHTDPCAVNVMINFDKEDKERQYSQDFYCHILCFKKYLRPSVPLYLEQLGLHDEIDLGF